MPIKQLMIFIEFTKKDISESGKEIACRQIVRVNLALDSIADFLNNLPTDIDETASVWISLTNHDDETISFADGADKYGKPMNEEVRKAHRETATLFAGRYLNRASYEGYIQPQLDEKVNKENAANTVTSLKRFVIWISVTKVATNSLGVEHVYNQVYDIDLVSENVSDFLAKLPDDIDDRTTVWVSLTRHDGKTISFADGADEYGNPLDEEARQASRETATLFAERRLNNPNDPT